jgi:beta-catenin-like protein 1
MEALDATSVKKLVANFEKALTKNQQQRSKFPDQPEKFMESEFELDHEIKRLQGIATTPSLYPELMRHKSHLSLLGLVSHENTDIAVDAIEVIEELTDGEPLTESPDTVCDLIDDLVRHSP